MSFLVLRSAAILVHLSKVVRVTGYVLGESGHFDKSGIIRLFHRDLLLTGPVSVANFVFISICLVSTRQFAKDTYAVS